MRARKWILGSLAGAAVLGCMTGPAEAQAPQRPAAASNPATKPPAIVNGEVISAADFDALLKRQGPEPTELPEKMRKLNRMEALSTLIDDLLRQQFLRKMSVPVSKADIDKRLAEVAEMLKAQGKTLEDVYRDLNQTPEQFRVAVGYQVQWIAYCNACATDEALFKYYTDNKDFFDGVMVDASHIVLRVPPDAPESEIMAARVKLTTLRTQILEKKIDFAQAAKTYSQCDSAARGGEIGSITRKGIDEAFTKTAFSLQVGQVSDVVQSSFGLHLIKVTARKPGTPSDFKTVKEKVRFLFLEELEEATMLDLRKNAKIEINLP